MASAKKGKKSKGKTLALQDFLQETPGVVSTVPIRKSTLNWADEVEDNHDVYDSRSAKASVVLPTAPKASRDFDDIIDKVPQDPPYMAYISNLPFDVDESEIVAFFRNMRIANMRIPKDERPGEPPKLKGFGYVEFEDRDSFLNALVIPDTTIKNRRIRIEIATDSDDKRRSGRSDMSRDRMLRSDNSGDWRSGPRQENPESSDRRGFNRDNRDRERDRDRDDSSGAWRSNREPERSFSRPSERFNRDDRDQEFSRSRGDRDRDRDRDDRGFMSRRYDNDRGSSRGGGFSRNPPPIREDPDSSRSSEPRQRPKLVLAPRTKPVEPESEAKSASASIFGNAKPVDTSARERQIEERLAKDVEPAPPRRELSPERGKEHVQDKENLVSRDKKEKERAPEPEMKIIEKTAHSPNADANGIIEKSQHSTRNGDHEKKDQQKTEAADKHKSDNKKREEKKEKTEKEMPKLKKAEAPNFIANNKFAYLDTEDNSD